MMEGRLNFEIADVGKGGRALRWMLTWGREVSKIGQKVLDVVYGLPRSENLDIDYGFYDFEF